MLSFGVYPQVEWVPKDENSYSELSFLFVDARGEGDVQSFELKAQDGSVLTQTILVRDSGILPKFFVPAIARFIHVKCISPDGGPCTIVGTVHVDGISWDETPHLKQLCDEINAKDKEAAA